MQVSSLLWNLLGHHPLCWLRKDRSLRFYIYYLKLNAEMKRGRWPLELIEDIFNEVKGSTVFATLDLFQRYWQIKMHKSCKEMLTLICGYGMFQFEVMPFGLNNSGETFQRMMDNVLANASNVKCYVDDFLVHSAYMDNISSTWRTPCLCCASIGCVSD